MNHMKVKKTIQDYGVKTHSLPLTATGTPSNIPNALPSSNLCVEAIAASMTESLLTLRKAALCSGASARSSNASATASGVNLPALNAE